MIVITYYKFIVASKVCFITLILLAGILPNNSYKRWIIAFQSLQRFAF